MTDQDKPDQNVDDDDTDATQPDLDKEADGAAEAVESDAENGSDVAPEKGESDEDLDLWAAAMAEQESHEAAETEQNGNGAHSESEEDDLWAAAMAEQQQTEPEETQTPAKQQAATTAADPNAEVAGERLFRPFEESNQRGETRDLAMILDIPVRLSVELGRTKVTIKQLLEMAQGSVVELDGLAGEPMDILINGYLIAQGEVVVVEDKYGIRITEIVTPSERVQKLNR
ncbi:flagellar motor switch protein FliN [Halochromatium salexigens]|uniref:Flagellar motor switch protein FliN n=1 Tax=Halochromatium salexigens TaxID=49447 RepID=A0AAJ0XF08_HALSE|nr:flagellar motor switch protein FliN [Halochromatium salexigens]